MAMSKEALELDGIPPGFEGKVDEADKLLSEAASEALSVLAGAIRPEEVPAPAPAPPAPDSMDVEAPASPSFAAGQRVVTIEEDGRTPRQGTLITCGPEICEAWLAPNASGYKVQFQDVQGSTLIAGFVGDSARSIRSDCS